MSTVTPTTLPLASCSFEVPGPPVPKGRARAYRTKSGKMGHFTPAKTKRYETTVRIAGMGAQAKSRGGIFGVHCGWPLHARYRVTCRAFFGDRRARDLDNVLKSLCDGLNGVMWRDDAQIDAKAITRHHDKERPRLEVEIEAYPSKDDGKRDKPVLPPRAKKRWEGILR